MWQWLRRYSDVRQTFIDISFVYFFHFSFVLRFLSHRCVYLTGSIDACHWWSPSILDTSSRSAISFKTVFEIERKFARKLIVYISFSWNRTPLKCSNFEGAAWPEVARAQPVDWCASSLFSVHQLHGTSQVLRQLLSGWLSRACTWENPGLPSPPPAPAPAAGSFVPISLGFFEVASCCVYTSVHLRIQQNCNSRNGVCLGASWKTTQHCSFFYTFFLQPGSLRRRCVNLGTPGLNTCRLSSKTPHHMVEGSPRVKCGPVNLECTSVKFLEIM